MSESEALEKLKKIINDSDSFVISIGSKLLVDAGHEKLASNSDYTMVNKSWLFEFKEEFL